MTIFQAPAPIVKESAKALEAALARAGSSEALAQAIGSKATTIRTWRARGFVPRAWADKVQAVADGAGRPAAAPVEPMPPGHLVKGVSTYVGPDGKVKGQWIKTDAGREDREETLRRLLAELPAEVPARRKAVPAPPPGHDPDMLAIYPMGDPHIGMLAWAPESGEDFDLRICEDLMAGAISDLVLRGPRTARALLVNLGDLLHSDNAQQTTTHGTRLDSDGRHAKVLDAGMRLITHTIDRLLEHHERVTVDSQIGNHDEYTAIMLAIGLRAYYRNEPRAEILVNPATRHYHEFGRNLIGTVHGDKTKADALPEIMAAEAAEAWGRTAHRVWLCGHVHHQSVKDYRGCRVETFRTLAARDAWHAGQGYVAPRDMQRLVLHREHGEVSREVCSVGYLRSRLSKSWACAS